MPCCFVSEICASCVFGVIVGVSLNAKSGQWMWVYSLVECYFPVKTVCMTESDDVDACTRLSLSAL